MAHIHSVYDTDSHFIVDPDTRMMKNVSESKITILQYDHNSERITFELPRYVDGHDMSRCNIVEIHYVNKSTDPTGQQNPGLYKVDDLQVSPEDENVVICSWLISQNATKISGPLQFLIRFACTTGEVIDYSWSTALYTGLTISKGLYNTDVLVEQSVDVLEQWRLNILLGGTGSSPVSTTSILDWTDLESFSQEELAKILEAAQLVIASELQAVFDSLLESPTGTLTIDGVDYTVRSLGYVRESLMYRNGALQICRKIDEAGETLRGEYEFEVVPCSDLSTVIKQIKLPCAPAQLLSGGLSRVSYADCGAYLDGLQDDYEAMYKAHYIGDLCGCDVVQHGGTIYKALSGWLFVKNHNVDLSGSTMKIDNYNRNGCYWLSATSIWTLEESVLSALRPQMTEYSNTWPAVETGFPTNGLFVVTHPDAIVRWNNGEQTSEDRVEIVRHACDGRVHSTVIDTAPDNADVVFIKYPNTQITFRGCTLSIDVSFGSVAIYFMRCERSNVIIRDFLVDPTRRTTMNIGYRGALFNLNECADIIMENIKGVNIAGRPRDEYPRGVAGYILNATCILDLTVRDCNLLGYWGCVGLNGAKEITFDGCELNRVDIHDYFRNLTINNCRIYGQTINFGYGKGAVNITNCSVMTDWVHQIVNLRCDYGRYFEGTINVSNVDAVYTGPTYFDIVSGVTMFSAESAEQTGLFMKRYPNINASNVTMHLMKESTPGYVFNMPETLEDTIEITDTRKVIGYNNVTVYDENGDLQQLGVCPLGNVVKSGTQSSVTE